MDLFLWIFAHNYEGTEWLQRLYECAYGDTTIDKEEYKVLFLLDILQKGRNMIQINGNSYNYEPGMTVYDYLEAHGFQMNAIAVERNLAILPKSKYREQMLEDGDCLEVVQFVGGG